MIAQTAAAFPKIRRAFDFRPRGLSSPHAAAYLPCRLHRAVPSTKTDELPSGDPWLHEIKHDGFRVIARKDGDRVRLYSRPGNDMTRRFPLIAERSPGCAHVPASSMGKPSRAMTTGSHRSSVSATASMTGTCFCTRLT
jgi:hypothetical protein